MELREIEEVPTFAARAFDEDGLTKGQIAIIKRLDVIEQTQTWALGKLVIAHNLAVQLERSQDRILSKALTFLAFCLSTGIAIYAATKK